MKSPLKGRPLHNPGQSSDEITGEITEITGTEITGTGNNGDGSLYLTNSV